MSMGIKCTEIIFYQRQCSDNFYQPVEHESKPMICKQINKSFLEIVRM